MGKFAGVFCAVAVAALLLPGCGGGGRPGLMGELPPGMDIYLTMSPEGVGVREILGSLRETALGGSEELAIAGSALGIDPLSWDEWVTATGLDPDAEMGVAVYASGSQPSAVALFLPVSDPATLESFLDVIPEDEEVRLSRWRDDMWVILASEVPQQLDMMAEALDSGERLADDQDFARLWDALGGGGADAHLYVRTHDRPELEAVLLALEEDGGVARVRAAALPSGPQFARSLSVMERGPAGDRPGLPSDVDLVVRSTVSMDAVDDMVRDQMPPDAEQGLAMLGFESVDDMLAMFSGDSWGAVDLSSDQIRGLAVIGLDDAGAMEGFLSRLSGFAAMGDQQVDRVRGGGVSGYSIPISSGPGAPPLQVGVSGSGLYILYGYSLEDVPGWSSRPATDEALGIDGSAPVFLAGSISGVRRRIPEDTGELLPEADRFAASIRAEGDVAVMEGALDTGEDRAFAAMARAVFSAGYRVYEARVTPPEEVDSK